MLCATPGRLRDHLLHTVNFPISLRFVVLDESDRYHDAYIILYSRVYRLRFMYKICRFLSVKFEFSITFFSIGPIYMICMGHREGMGRFSLPHKQKG
jgi:hypothetical protein